MTPLKHIISEADVFDFRFSLSPNGHRSLFSSGETGEEFELWTAGNFPARRRAWPTYSDGGSYLHKRK